MKLILIVVGAAIALLAVLAIVVYTVGSRLPQNHIAARSIRLQRPLSEVYSAVRDFGASAKWRTDVQKVEMLDATSDGHLQFREHGSNGTITYELLEDVPNHRLVTRIVDRDLGYAGSWTYVFSSSGNSTTLQVTENGEVSNPLFRFMSRYVFGHTATMDAYLKALAQHFGQTAMPQDAASGKY